MRTVALMIEVEQPGRDYRRESWVQNAWSCASAEPLYLAKSLSGASRLGMFLLLPFLGVRHTAYGPADSKCGD
jgi:hypothetical protein